MLRGVYPLVRDARRGLDNTTPGRGAPDDTSETV